MMKRSIAGQEIRLLYLNVENYPNLKIFILEVLFWLLEGRISILRICQLTKKMQLNLMNSSEVLYLKLIFERLRINIFIEKIIMKVLFLFFLNMLCI